MVRMRKSEREVQDRTIIDELMHRSQVLRLGLVDGEDAYLVPVCFGYEQDVLFIHSAKEGRKLEAIKAHPRVCFEVDEGEVTSAKQACRWSAKYMSIIGWGVASLVDDADKKRLALDVIMRHYGGGGPFHYDPASLDEMIVIRIDVEEMSCKRSI